MSVNNQHMAWKDRLKKEKHGIANSMTKGIVLDIVSQVQVNPSEKSRIFQTQGLSNSQSIIGGFSPSKNMEDLSPNEKKAKYLEFLIQQRRNVSTDNSFDDAISNLNGMKQQDDGGRFINDRYIINNKNTSNNLNFAPYGVMTQHNQSNYKTPNESINHGIHPININNMLPPVKRSYYLAHSVDLSHPVEYVNIKINEKAQKDDIYYDNKRDHQKVQNRSISPNDAKDISLKNLSTIDIQTYDKRNMGYSKEMPLQTSVYSRDHHIHSNKTGLYNNIDYYTKTANQSQLGHLPIINKSTSLVQIDQKQQNPENIMQKIESDIFNSHKDSINEVMHPLKKDQSFNKLLMSTKLEKEILKQINILYDPSQNDEQQFLEDELIETQSVSTVGGAGEKIVNNYKSDLDPTLFAAQKIRCCMCGIMTVPNDSNTCINCLKSEIDVTEGISKQLILQNCKECNRYLRPPWQQCELESPELLSLCLKNVKGLKRVKLIDAGFVWTEPHSRRIKVKLTVQKEVMNRTVLQQSFVVEFTIQNQQCDECKKTYTPHLWNSAVQVRQRVDHKRTFLFLEQLIIKHKAADRAIGIKEVHDGLDFQFKNKADANKLVDFIANTVPTKVKQSQQLISHDLRNNTYNYKYTFSLEIAPICKDDLVILPKTLSNLLGGIGPMVLVYKISTFVNIVDIYSMQTYEIDQITYWKYQFTALCGRDRLTEFVVINVDNADHDVNVSRAAAKQRFKMVSVEIQRKDDYGKNDLTFTVNTHLGEVLNYFDTVLGFDLDQMNMTELDEFSHLKREIPPVILVKKTFPKYRQKQKNRAWKLKHLEKEAIDENNHHKKDKANNKHQRDYDLFMQDIEEDVEMRQHVDLFKNDEVIEKSKKKDKKLVADDEENKDQKGNKKKSKMQVKADVNSEDDDDQSIEEDFPHIKVHELKSIEEQLAQININDEQVDPVEEQELESKI
ncbi:UNKNOWN [Stylonychia lemnae]|uniref:60S ribosomal export protein NMD3 n=1 Tax=Stylonychia lemnae TaxID=5949 RepID=A0A077ZVH1_STYLE|nr:UNKNOWN [Stylonychia lemnae]|eukprot:CDW73854.1 UNKNOWN [Stylonychia lemnae]